MIEEIGNGHGNASADIHEERLPDRPGGPLVSWLRGLCDSLRGAVGVPRTGNPAREIRGDLGHRLLEPLPVLHEHVRVPHHSRARSGDVFQQHLKETLRKAAAHRGSAYIEILQNCNIFNDGAWEDLTDKDARSEQVIQLEHGKPLIFGKNREKGIRLKGLELEVVQLGNGVSEKDLLMHDEKHPRASYAFMLAHMEQRPGVPTPIGVLRAQDDVPCYEDLMNHQIRDVIAKRCAGDVSKLLSAGDTWIVK